MLELASTPAKAQKLTRARITKLLSEHRIRRFSAEAVCAILQQPSFQLVPGTVEAASERVLLLLPLLRLIERQRHAIAAKVGDLLAEMAASPAPDEDPYQHRDVELILSLPGVGRVVAATMLAEASQALAERDYYALRAYAGRAPITRQSGKKATVLMRQGCNGRLRNAIYHWSRVNVQIDSRSRQQYQRLKQAGHTHGRALRGVGDRLLALLVAMLRDGTLYEPSRRITQGPELAISGQEG